MATACSSSLHSSLSAPRRRSKAADCTVIGKGEAEWSLRDNIVGDSAASASTCAWYTKTFKLVLQLRGWDQRESSASLLQPYHHNKVRMYVMMNSHTKSGMYIRIYFFVNSQWYERVLETVAGLPRRSRRLARSFYTVTTYDVCMYVVAVDNESKLFIIA